jgi:hypothetical protein
MLPIGPRNCYGYYTYDNILCRIVSRETFPTSFLTGFASPHAVDSSITEMEILLLFTVAMIKLLKGVVYMCVGCGICNVCTLYEQDSAEHEKNENLKRLSLELSV